MNKKLNRETALKYALRLLKARVRTNQQMHNKLKDKGYNEEVITNVIDCLKKNKYLDDYLYAKLWINNKISSDGIGLFGIKHTLKIKGVSDIDIDKAIKELIDGGDYDEYKIAKQVMKQIVNKNKDKNKLKRQIYNALTRKGFSEYVMETIMEEIEI